MHSTADPEPGTAICSHNIGDVRVQQTTLYFMRQRPDGVSDNKPAGLHMKKRQLREHRHAGCVRELSQLSNIQALQNMLIPAVRMPQPVCPYSLVSTDKDRKLPNDMHAAIDLVQHIECV